MSTRSVGSVETLHTSEECGIRETAKGFEGTVANQAIPVVLALTRAMSEFPTAEMAIGKMIPK